ncbi:MAG: response regulator, partial [Mariniblastus sp.]
GSQFSVLVPLSNLDSILKCYFDQREASLEETGEISLTEVFPSCDEFEDRDAALDTIDEFLRASVKSFDLVLQPSEDRWLIYSCNSKTTLQSFKDHILQEWTHLKRNHYGPLLPDLVLDNKLTTNAVEGRDQLIRLARPNVSQNKQPVDQSQQTKILVVDDETEVVDAIEARLQASGFDVATARDGLAGLDAVEKVQPDAILLDIRMPKLDGLSVLRKLKANPLTARTPVIVLSASLRDKQRVLERGASFFIQKPYQSESLMAALDAVMDKEHPHQNIKQETSDE